MTRPFITRLGLAALLLCCHATLTSCHSLLPYKMGGNPANLRPGATELEVYHELGSPSYRVPHQYGEKWVYLDYWWVKEIWTPHWGTWEVYMEEVPGFLKPHRFTGWKLVDPPTQEPDVRSAIYVRKRHIRARATPPPPPAASTEKVEASPKESRRVSHVPAGPPSFAFAMTQHSTSSANASVHAHASLP